jgi:hypothetical protein
MASNSKNSNSNSKKVNEVNEGNVVPDFIVKKFKKMKKSELFAFAKENNLEVKSKNSKELLLEKIFEQVSFEDEVETSKKSKKLDKIMELVNKRIQDAIDLLNAKWEEEIKNGEISPTLFESSIKKKFKGLDEDISKALEKQKPLVKAPLSAFNFFTKEVRQEIKDKNPEAPFGEISKLLGQKWKECEDKEEFEEKAMEDKQRFMRDVEDLDECDEKEKLMKKVLKMKGEKKKSSSSPTRGKSAWIVFCSENRAKVQKENKGMKPGDVTKKLSEIWKTLSQEEKNEYKVGGQEKKEYKVGGQEKKEEKVIEKKEKVIEKEEKEEKKEKVVEKEEKKKSPSKKYETDREKELNKMKVGELKDLAKELEISYAGKIKKEELIALIYKKECECEAEEDDEEFEEDVEEEEEEFEDDE